MKSMRNSRLVYSTETGRICVSCRKPVNECVCKKRQEPPRETDGIIRIRRETKGRKGKTATILYGFDLNDEELKEFAARLKRLCGSGGSVKDGQIMIQGDHRQGLLADLKKLGYRVKLAGG
jgi:translation initiation factor 1